MNESPLVSIGIPVYNEASYLGLTLNSLLTQDYPNLELIISDNASTDQTPEICRMAVDSDPRLRYLRAEINEGAVKNFNTVFLHAKGKYFMWAGAHDLWEPNFVSRAVSLLESDSAVILAYPKTMLIDAKGLQLTTVPDEMDTRNLSAFERYRKFIRTVHWCNMMHGLIRSEVLRSTGLFRSVWGSDILLLAELSLKGAFAQIPEILFYRRENRPELDETNIEEWKQRYLKTMEGSHTTEQQSQASPPELFRELRNAVLQVLRNSDLPYHRKLHARLETWISFSVRYNVRFTGDILLSGGNRVAHLAKRLAGGLDHAAS